MIFLQLAGGLGNQLFMYAAAKALALKTNSELLLDTCTGFIHDPYKRRYMLDDFQLKFTPAPRLLSWRFPGGRAFRRLSRKLGYHCFYPSFRRLDDYQPFPSNAQDIWLDGYWQSEKYFLGFDQQIREDLTITRTMPAETLEEGEVIKKSGDRAIAVGVRSYQEVKNIPAGHVQGKEYFHRAFDEMAKQISDPVFFVFAQMQETAKKILPVGKFDIRFISAKKGDERAVEDLWLQTLCSHHIISMSSFYWWGAWLGKKKRQIVITPPRPEYPQFCCANWLIIKE